MNYELAKELKGAGYPQPTEIEGIHVCIDPEMAYHPALSIEACGEDFICLFHVHPQGDGRWDEWAANNVHYGSTPEEAVAELWLAPNKRS